MTLPIHYKATLSHIHVTYTISLFIYRHTSSVIIIFVVQNARFGRWHAARGRALRRGGRVCSKHCNLYCMDKLIMRYDRIIFTFHRMSHQLKHFFISESQTNQISSGHLRLSFLWSTSLGWGKGGQVPSAWWQVKLYDPISYEMRFSIAVKLLLCRHSWEWGLRMEICYEAYNRLHSLYFTVRSVMWRNERVECKAIQFEVVLDFCWIRRLNIENAETVVTPPQHHNEESVFHHLLSVLCFRSFGG